jgi:hypothetical protein
MRWQAAPAQPPSKIQIGEAGDVSTGTGRIVDETAADGVGEIGLLFVQFAGETLDLVGVAGAVRADAASLTWSSQKARDQK